MKKKSSKKLSLYQAVKGALRKRHFESGGDTASWRGRANVYVDRKKKANKQACRGKFRGRLEG